MAIITIVQPSLTHQNSSGPEQSPPFSQYHNAFICQNNHHRQTNHQANNASGQPRNNNTYVSPSSTTIKWNSHQQGNNGRTNNKCSQATAGSIANFQASIKAHHRHCSSHHQQQKRHAFEQLFRAATAPVL